ncbi:beta-glucosidase family protein [Spirochaeta isovalerica]|uniref:Beta-glucosidase n=1 Tax=Spirochaeta isovalerica TaxID=150 RepID=A0A841RC90_9SPIO|nr:glycoside hydrolase family 3 C-terminal domain-containing protein [Spirochaeta isovalerica]MBB6481605.1 beta-glucosidase [Spirochaeta isovalerica]
MSDASCGVNIRETWLEDRVDTDLEKSVSFPCMLQLASTWNRDLFLRYAGSIGEECRAGGIHILLGPGMNIYRHSQCGRNFEYGGEDPYLVSELIGRYVEGLQEKGVVATLKHFIANNTDFYRRKSNSIVGKRALHEIYLPAFKKGVEAGARAVMTAYNLFNGEWCSQNRKLINEILREELGFQWLVMTDWWAINDCEKAIKSGLDLEMPAGQIFKEIPRLLEEKRISEADIDRMVLNILKTAFSMDLYNPGFQDKSYLDNFDEHEAVALQTAAEGIVLLKNEADLLPLESGKDILLTGRFAEETARGGGAAEVEGFNHMNLLDALKEEFGSSIRYVKNPSDEELRNADAVIIATGTMDSEGCDRSFNLPDEEERCVLKAVGNSSKAIVLVNAGGGVRMTGWSGKAAAILYCWYGGQQGNRAVASVLSGKINPSGKLPITIEKEFSDSPGFGYIPEGESLYKGWDPDGEKAHAVYPVEYSEGIFIGYRWYEHKKVEPLYPFGFGLSYTEFEYKSLKVSLGQKGGTLRCDVDITIKNTGLRDGLETVQLYVGESDSSVIRPVKELKGFEKVHLKPAEEKTVRISLERDAFCFWDENLEQWTMNSGVFTIAVGTSSDNIQLKETVSVN